MSDFFRIPTLPELADLGPCQLARLSHKAEDTDDDILLIQVADEMSRRSALEQDVFKQAYIMQHRPELRKKP